MIREDHEYFMELALHEARRAYDLGEVPIGAVVIDKEGQVLGRGYNLREWRGDPTAHAEMLAIQAAAAKRKHWRLHDCRLYVTIEPCMMCAGAIQLSRISHVVYGAENPKGGALRSSGHAYAFERLNHYPVVTGGILAQQCGNIIQDFFREKRLR
ncbi:nucleoside deaminase [Sulfoacidibacillus thermotolerans]|uniref:tRNA-specific adenosine deaminase n=1 Tax=Sulfoacidibacillus thermotolerans TaxID=1765684 RepID=A0A2U3D8F1_SULT2|nr:nucleoside deaminase [Sulfoacidibacillus thermotolerans]PWI57539.1 tRNA-specific adenosine deaminase [Sulfoacidibacillus thermotolerans]